MTLSSHDTASLPLSGVKVLDLTRVLAGPICTMMLGDLGADVIKVERPGTGDETRGWSAAPGGMSPYFTSINRSKLSLAVDLNSYTGQRIVRTLFEEADVVVDNFLPGMLQKRGLNPEDALRAWPNLIWCTITGFGAANPRPGYDFVTQAEAGWMAITGDPAGEPTKVGVALADVMAGKDAAIAILAALAGRGSGRPIDRRIVISLIDSARAALVNVAQTSLATGREAKRWGNAHSNIVPYQLFHASDQPIVIAVGSDSQWRACVEALGAADLRDDPSLAANDGRLEHRERVVARIEKTVRTRSAAHWLERLAAAGVPAGVVKTVLQALEGSGASPTMGMPSSVGGRWRLPPPTLDEHGATIRQLGWRVFDD